VIQVDTEADLGHHEIVEATRDHHIEEGRRLLECDLSKEFIILMFYVSVLDCKL